MINREVSRGNHFLNYLITYFAIAFSGIPFFDGNVDAKLYFLIILIVIFILKSPKFSNKIIIIFIITFLLLFTQKVIFGGGSYFTFITFTGLVVLMPYLVLKIVGPKFFGYFLDTIFFIALVSLAFWLATNLIPGFINTTYAIAGQLMPYTTWEIQESLILYTVEFAEIYGMNRNPGPFHEPGAYAVFIALGIVLELLRSGKLLTRYNIVFIISVITTFSTAGYLSLFIIFGFFFLTSPRLNMLQKTVYLIFALPLLIYLFINLEFLNEKIALQSQTQFEQSLDNRTSGRFLGARKALIVLQRYPLHGRGLLEATQADTYSEEASGYGWIHWLARLGLVFGIAYLYFMYKTILNFSLANNQTKLFSYFAFAAILAALAGQKHTSSVVFFALFLMSLEYSTKLYPLTIYRLNSHNEKR